VFIVLGLANVGSDILVLTSRVRVANSIGAQNLVVSQWNTAANALNTGLTSWTTTLNACGKSLACAEAADAQGAAVLTAFASEVKAIAMPWGAAAAADETIADATRASADLTTLSQDKTAAEYQADMASSALSPDLGDVQADVNLVANALDISAP